MGGAQQQLLDTVGGVPAVRAFRLAGEHAERVRSQDVVDLALRVVRLQTGFFGGLNLAELVGVAAVLTTGFILVRSGAASIGTASATALYFINLADLGFGTTPPWVAGRVEDNLATVSAEESPAARRRPAVLDV